MHSCIPTKPRGVYFKKSTDMQYEKTGVYKEFIPKKKSTSTYPRSINIKKIFSNKVYIRI